MTYRYPGGLVRRTAANTSITGASGVWDLGSQAQAVKTNTWPISGLANPVSGSLRFRASASAYLTRTLGSSGSLRAWTWSAWVKRGTLGVQQDLFGWVDLSGGNFQQVIGFNSDNTLEFQMYNSILGGYVNRKTTSQVFRDPSAWYHIVVVWDSNNATANDRAIIYINGSRVTAWANNTNPSLNQDSYINNSSYPLGIARCMPSSSAYFDGYLAEVNFVDGQALTPSSFGQTSPITGVWEPIKYTGTYGTNGFYLSLSDTSSIGKDFSGNGNNWTPNNISTANDSTFDLMRDVPTQWAPQGVTDVGGTVRGNYCTLNPLDFTTVGTISNGNLRFVQSSSGARSGRATFGVSSGKWYWEYTHLGGNSSPGIGNASMTLGYYCGGDANGWSYFVGGSKYNNDASTSYGASYTTNDVIGVALDMDAGTLVFYKNGASQGTAFSSLTGTMFPAFSSSSVSNVTFTVNFGQQPFAYTPPSGFKSLCTTNLPTPTIGATTATAANKYFDATLYTGNGANNRTISSNLTPDFVWMKDRTNAYSHILIDSVRGTGKYLRTNGTDAENWDGNIFPNSGPTTNGFIVDGGLNVSINANGDSYVGWQWNAGGSTVTNTTGSISAQVRASTTAGFSIVTYNTGSAGTQTVGHGLGVTPAMIIIKSRINSGAHWDVWHKSFANPAQGYMYLNLTNALANDARNYSNTAPTSSLFTYESGYEFTANQNFVAYFWAEIEGYSKFGSYIGNGSTDGPFVYTGFRPRWILLKRSSSASQTYGWQIYDTARSTYNASSLPGLWADTSAAEAGSTYSIDLLSNGFKLKDSNINMNSSGDTYIYAAFAETPFKNSLAR